MILLGPGYKIEPRGPEKIVTPYLCTKFEISKSKKKRDLKNCWI